MIDHSIRPVLEGYLEIPEGLKNGIACSICKHLVTVISNIIKTKIKPIQVQEEAQKLCSKFLKIGRDFCNNIITKYLTKITELIQQKVSISNVCDKLKLCVSNSDDDDSYLELYLDMDDNDFVSDFELPMSLSNADTCSICAKTVGFVTQFSRNHRTCESIKPYVIAYCNKLTPQLHATLCKTIVFTSLGGILRLFAQSGFTKSSKQICDTLKLCNANEPVSNHGGSDMCISIVGIIRSAYENELMLEAEDICEMCPAKQYCYRIFEYINYIYNLFDQGQDSGDICRSFGAYL
ncbi:saposin A [Histomonas meleagridis]|uniref:saposin A n=1 Tax=Histomonas meleagridis TaxID=135588 RepID=UPI00355A7660|nr:saposin A [Histomonas meleagridis]KAH0796092.1 saposin A [Histomonas meleagridis]